MGIEANTPLHLNVLAALVHQHPVVGSFSSLCGLTFCFFFVLEQPPNAALNFAGFGSIQLHRLWLCSWQLWPRLMLSSHPCQCLLAPHSTLLQLRQLLVPLLCSCGFWLCSWQLPVSSSPAKQPPVFSIELDEVSIPSNCTSLCSQLSCCWRTPPGLELWLCCWQLRLCS